jgi:uncharacterized membrane protein YphA (DoxX/SURF4 family)
MGIRQALAATNLSSMGLATPANPEGRCLYRLYSTFPGGWSGFGLLLLRVALGATVLIQGSAYLFERQDLRFGPWAVCLLALGSGGALVMGFLTPIASVVVLLGGMGIAFSWLPVPSWNLFSGNPLSMDAIIMALAAVFLGPGAFSLDARLFGRRRVIIPSVSRSPKP